MALNITDLIARHLLEVHEGDNWTEVNIRETLQDLPLAAALERTPASANTIAGLLHHISFWNRVVGQRIAGVAPEIPEDNGFLHPPLHTEADWLALQQDNLRSAQELAAVIKSIPGERLEEPILPGASSVYRNLQGIVEHTHYHLGQIVILKQWLQKQGRA